MAAILAAEQEHFEMQETENSNGSITENGQDAPALGTVKAPKYVGTRVHGDFIV